MRVRQGFATGHGARAAVTLGAGVALLLAGGGAGAADTIDAVHTPGAGELTMCRSWIVYDSCNTYHKVKLPARITVGDEVHVTFGSNNKDYLFEVVRILHEGDSCKILSKASAPSGDGERLDVTNCQPSDKPAAASK